MAGLRVPPMQSSFMTRGLQMGQQSLGAYTSQRPNQKTEYTPPDPTVGGALAAGATTAMAGASLGASIGAGTSAGATVGGGYGAAIGAVVGIIGYLLS